MRAPPPGLRGVGLAGVVGRGGSAAGWHQNGEQSAHSDSGIHAHGGQSRDARVHLKGWRGREGSDGPHAGLHEVLIWTCAP